MANSEFKSRLYKERDELKDKITKLKSFINGTNFVNIDKTQQELLIIQRNIMRAYLNILDMRIIRL